MAGVVCVVGAVRRGTVLEEVGRRDQRGVRPHDVITDLPAVVNGLKDRFNTEGDVNLTAEEKNYDAHAVASLLKLYFRELPSSIPTRELHLEFLATQEKQGRDKVVALNVLVRRGPRGPE